MGDLFGFKEDTGNQRRPVNLVYCSHGFRFENKLYSVVCCMEPIEIAVGLDAAGRGGA